MNEGSKELLSGLHTVAASWLHGFCLLPELWKYWRQGSALDSGNLEGLYTCRENWLPVAAKVCVWGLGLTVTAWSIGGAGAASWKISRIFLEGVFHLQISTSKIFI